MIRRLVALGTLLAAGVAGGEQALPLGKGTACAMLRQGEVRKELGVRGRHVLTCASPSGDVVRVFLTATGKVTCIDREQVGADGKATMLGARCVVGATATPAASVAKAGVVNLTGSWNVSVFGTTCQVDVVQDGDGLQVNGTCPLFGQFAGTGSISFADHTFDSTGTVSGFLEDLCQLESARMSGTVTADGQGVQGSVGCGSESLGFTAVRASAS
jgi:hypothetical protein